MEYIVSIDDVDNEMAIGFSGGPGLPYLVFTIGHNI